LDDLRTAVVSCAAVSLGTTEAARTSFTGTATPDQAMVFVTTVSLPDSFLSHCRLVV
jgi:hypothetical protein